MISKKLAFNKELLFKVNVTIAIVVMAVFCFKLHNDFVQYKEFTEKVFILDKVRMDLLQDQIDRLKGY